MVLWLSITCINILLTKYRLSKLPDYCKNFEATCWVLLAGSIPFVQVTTFLVLIIINFKDIKKDVCEYFRRNE